MDIPLVVEASVLVEGVGVDELVVAVVDSEVVSVVVGVVVVVSVVVGIRS